MTKEHITESDKKLAQAIFDKIYAKGFKSGLEDFKSIALERIGAMEPYTSDMHEAYCAIEAIKINDLIDD